MKKNALLIHGWDYELYTNMTNEINSWHYAKEFVDSLSKIYNVYQVNLPGFCGEKEPKEKEWNVSDFANYINNYILENKLDIDLVIGYSFGGAVAITWKNIFNNDSKLFLIAPAIIRNQDKSKNFKKTPPILDGIRKFLRNLYVIYIVKTPEMKYGTTFLKNSYQKIVREDLRNTVIRINPKDLLIVYGEKDTAVSPKEVINTLPKSYQIKMIPNANHDNIINEYKEEVLNYLK